jgi:hypothetical protein
MISAILAEGAFLGRGSGHSSGESEGEGLMGILFQVENRR